VYRNYQSLITPKRKRLSVNFTANGHRVTVYEAKENTACSVEYIPTATSRLTLLDRTISAGTNNYGSDIRYLRLSLSADVSVRVSWTVILLTSRRLRARFCLPRENFRGFDSTNSYALGSGDSMLEHGML